MSWLRRLLSAPLLPAALPLLLFAVSFAALYPSAVAPRADFAMNNGGEIATLDPAHATGVPEGRVVRALFEGLLTRNPINSALEPGLAESHDISADGLVYTFQMRKGARWSNGDPVTAGDFEWNLRRVLEPDTASPFAHELWCVRGARAYNTGRDPSGNPVARDWQTVGIRATNDAELVIALEHPVPYFLQLLASWQLAPIHPRSFEEARATAGEDWGREWCRPEKLIVNGPFSLASRRINEHIRLQRNPDYWDAEHVAFRSIDVFAIEQWSTALNLYLTGEIDWLDGTIPPSMVPELIRREDYNPSPYLGLYFYRVNTTKPPLNDKQVRRALFTAINRTEICDRVLKAGQRPCTTLIPWGKIGTYTSPPAPRENPRGAPMFLKIAGYGEGAREFPKLEILYNSGATHREIAEVVAEYWSKVLDIKVRLRNQEWKSYVDSQVALEYDVCRGSWISDYPDPMTFFAVFTSDSENNRTGWSNAEYDRLVRAASVEGDVQQRNVLLQQAEMILLDELPILPIYAYVSQNLVNPRLGGLGGNSLNDQSPKHWYWRSDADVARLRRDLPPTKRKADTPGPREGLYSPAVQRQKNTTGEIAR